MDNMILKKKKIVYKNRKSMNEMHEFYDETLASLKIFSSKVPFFRALLTKNERSRQYAKERNRSGIMYVM